MLKTVIVKLLLDVTLNTKPATELAGLRRNEG
jgi:hypothetical protein